MQRHDVWTGERWMPYLRVEKSGLERNLEMGVVGQVSRLGSEKS